MNAAIKKHLMSPMCWQILQIKSSKPQAWPTWDARQDKHHSIKASCEVDQPLKVPSASSREANQKGHNVW